MSIYQSYGINITVTVGRSQSGANSNGAVGDAPVSTSTDSKLTTIKRPPPSSSEDTSSEEEVKPPSPPPKVKKEKKVVLFS